MAAALEGGDQRRMERLGMRSIDPKEALGALAAAARMPRANVGVLSLDFTAFVAPGIGLGLQRFLGHVMGRPSAERGASAGAAPVRDLAAEVAAAPESRRRAIVGALVREQTLRTLGLAPDFPLDPRQGLRDIGLDSLMAVELRNALQQIAARPLPSTLLFDYPTAEGLSAYLLEVVRGPDQDSRSPKGTEVGALVEVPVGDDISEDEAENQLREELAKLRMGGPSRG
jgi:acyl carrier protein